MYSVAEKLVNETQLTSAGLLCALVMLLTTSGFLYSLVEPRRLAKHIILEKEIPSARERREYFFSQPRDLLIKGYQRFREEIWGIESSAGVRLQLPIGFLDELKSHSALSFEKFISSEGMLDYTGVGGLSDDAVHKFKSKFNPTVGAYVPELHDIVKVQMDKLFHKHEDWTEVNINDGIMEMVSILSARVFTGTEASQNVEWLELGPSYVTNVLVYIEALKRWPKVLRPLVIFFFPQRQLILRQWEQAKEFLSSTIAKHKLQQQQINDPPSLMDYFIDDDRINLEDMVRLQMAIVVAGIHTTSASLTQLLYDLAAYPEGIPELRKEIKHLYEENGRVLNKKALSELKKLDSWMKESQRFRAPDLTTFQRLAVDSLTLSNGLYIPRGTKMELPTTAIQVDDRLYEKPQVFDGLRFYEGRQKKGNENKHLYISTGKLDLAWGYGRHACPGRFIADVEIKLVMAEFLLRFDIRNPAGQPRHPDLEFESNLLPDPKKTVMLKIAKQH
ncbi:unnamed protein product [Clonostachys rosea f. rosea IK726]|uniref:Cytochrome P450 n=2 Tax=Bionectria ochroleuca TaxID=29856 RepID=A0A0B7KI58_BIOOC|nr:unnamed protein product [Clonostachys rosea f. rosea IK726]